MVFVWFCILWACIGGTYTFFPTIITETFGFRYNGILIGFILLAEIPSCLLFTFLMDNVNNVNTISVVTNVSGWHDVIIIMASLSLLSFILSITFNRKQNQQQKEQNQNDDTSTSNNQITAFNYNIESINQTNDIDERSTLINSNQSSKSNRIATIDYLSVKYAGNINQQQDFTIQKLATPKKTTLRFVILYYILYLLIL